MEINANLSDKARHDYMLVKRATEGDQRAYAELMDRYRDEEPVENELIEFWTARNDARAFIVFGDPAVRLRPDLLSKFQ